ncbi:C-reactive protein-like [Labrus mixtus]|uniref:C-reactive protein-like n=1 Tax=Labrus mixtus TaxID=508554 RepID=UPI0029C00CA7|nr:C-reactive protein-like [Labrus mixtus]
MKQLVLLAALCAGHASGKDLSEKVFTFPVESATSSVKLIANVAQPLTVLTMCMRFFSSLTRAQSLFSLDIPSQSNAFLLFKPSVDVYRLHINGAALDISGLPDETNEWNSVCWTWDSTSGLTALWVNGKRSPRAIMGASVSLSGVPSIILGQDQDSYGGGFDQSQSFVGDITDVHMWDKVISPCEIRFYMDGSAFTPGNLLSWNNLRFSTTGTVHEEQSDFNKSCF